MSGQEERIPGMNYGKAKPVNERLYERVMGVSAESSRARKIKAEIYPPKDTACEVQQFRRKSDWPRLFLCPSAICKRSDFGLPTWDELSDHMRRYHKCTPKQIADFIEERSETDRRERKDE